MKKYLFLLLLLFSIKVYALDNNIECEENICNIYFTINENYNLDELNININDLKLIEGNYYNIIINNLSNIKYNYINNSLTTNIVYRCNTSEPLMYLFDGIPLAKEYMSDYIIDKKLKVIGYNNGIKDLYLYYLDYINKNYNENYKNIMDISQEYFKKIWPDNYDNYLILETNSELINLYNSNALNFISILPNSRSNIYNFYYKDNTNLDLKFRKDSKFGSINIYYTDTLGNYLIDKEVISGAINEDYEIKEKKFNNYYLVEIKGDAVGNFDNTNKDVYFIYDLKNTEELVFKESNSIDYLVNNKHSYFYNLMSLIILVILWLKR